MENTVSFALCLTFLAIAPLVCPETARSEEPLWTLTVDTEVAREGDGRRQISRGTKHVRWLDLTEAGHLVAATDAGLVGIDTAEGTVAWTIEELKGLEQVDFNLLPFTEYAVVNNGEKGPEGDGKRMMVIDCVTGEEKWNSRKLGFQRSMGHFLVPSIGGLLIYGRNVKGKKWMRMADLETGELVWENHEFFEDCKPNLIRNGYEEPTLFGNQPPLFDTPQTMITFMNKKAIRKWDVKTGEKIWEVNLKAKIAPALQYLYPPILMDWDHGIAFVPYGKKLVAVRCADGSLVWDRAVELGEHARQMQTIPEGLLVGQEALLHESQGG